MVYVGKVQSNVANKLERILNITNNLEELKIRSRRRCMQGCSQVFLGWVGGSEIGDRAKVTHASQTINQCCNINIICVQNLK